MGHPSRPPSLRKLSGLDLSVLWGDLSIGLLVMVSGALLVPALGLPQALLAIAVGSLIGTLPLALVGWPARARACPAWCCSGRCSASAARTCPRRST